MVGSKCLSYLIYLPAYILTYLSQLNAHRFPVWASLARDHLSIMASSVLSERAFSSAGITISKCRNLLKADIVEALQFLKCAFQKDLIFREPEPSSTTEEAEGDLPELEKDLASWDTLADLGEDENDSDIDNVVII